MGNFDEAVRALPKFAQLHEGGSVLATIALGDQPAPPIIIWQHRVFHQTCISNEQMWWYDEIEALWVDQ